MPMAKGRNGGRKCKYQSLIQPKLEEIKKMYLTMTETQIAQSFGLTIQTWIRYKKNYPELAEALADSKGQLVEELKTCLKKKAQGFYFTETTKTKITNEAGETTTKIETKTRYAQPDTGAIHLLLKNLDKDWRNDDMTTVEMKKKQMELNERKVESAEW